MDKLKDDMTTEELIYALKCANKELLDQIKHRLIIQGRKRQTENPETITGADGIEYYWDGPMAMYKPIKRF